MPFLKTQRSTLALLCGLFLLAANVVQAQYTEQFNTANRGYLINCTENFAGVSWTLSDWDPTGLCRISPPDAVTDLRDPDDYFHTTGGVLTGVDFDEQLCWISPTLTVPNSGVGFSVKIGWTQFDREDISNNASDYIDVEYSTNGGANWTRLPTSVGAGLSGHTVCYINNNGGGPSSGPTNNNNPGNPSLSTFSASGIAGGGTLIIRICAQFNQTAETITIDDVSVPLATVGGCTAPTLSTTVTNVSCNGGSTGTIDLTVSGGGTPPYTYAWTGGATTQDRTNLAIGSYTVTVTDALMCSATTTATIGTAPAITRSTVVGDATCAAVADGGVDLTVSGGVPPYTYSWTNGAMTQDIDNVTPGTYTVVITDAPGCTSTISATVGVAAAGPYNETFAAAGKGYLPNFEDNFVGVSWSIDPWVLTDINNIGREADDYYRTSGGALVGVDLDRNVCWNSPIIDINPPGSGVSFTVDFAWTSLDREDITNVASDFIDVEYSVDNGAWTRVPTTAPATGLSGHTISYRNNNGGGQNSGPTDNNGSLVLTVPGLSGSTLRIRVCSQFNSEDESISINSVSASAGSGVYCPAPESNAGGDQMICDGTGATLAAIATNGTGAWSVVSGPSTSNAQFSNTSAANATFTPAGGAGTYTLRWTVSAIGFSDATDDVVITVKAKPSATITPNPNPVCQNTTLNLSVPDAGVGASYNWSGSGIVNTNANSTTAVPSATGSQAYAVTVTGANACSATGSVNVTVNARPSATITPNPNPVCQGSILNLSVPNAGGSYNWSGNGVNNTNTNSTTAVPNTTGAQAYAVTVTGANGCTNTGTVNVTVNALPSATITPNPDPVCQGSTLNLSVPSAGGSYNWSGSGIVNTNANTTTAVPSATGSQAYAVTVTGANGCTNTGTVNVTVNAQPSVTITPNPNPVCQGTTLNLSTPDAGVGASYNWSGSGIVNTNANSTTAVPSATGSQPYAVTVTGANACSATSSTNVTVNVQPSATITIGGLACEGVILNLSVPDAGVGASYSWSGPGVVSSNTAATTAMPPGTGLQTYMVTVTTANNCSNTSSNAVTVYAIPSATITPNPNPVCQNAILNLSVPNAGGGASYSWSGNGVPNNNAPSVNAVPNTSGSQTYSVTVTANGCSNTGSVSVTVNPAPSVSPITGGGTYCGSAIVNLTAPAGGTNYTWQKAYGDFPGSIYSNIGSGNPFNPTASGFYRVVVTNSFSCTAISAPVIVNMADHQFTGSLGAGDAQQTGRLNRFANVSTCASPMGCPGVFTPTGARYYDSYTLTNNSGSSACVTIGLNSTCGTNSFVVAYSGSFNPASLCTNYLGDPGSSPTTSIFYEVTVPANGTIVVVVQEVNVGSGCGTYTLTVDIPSIALTVTPNPLCIGSQLNLSATTIPGANYSWSGDGVVNTNSNTTTAVPVATGSQTYTVSVTNAIGCPISAMANVTVNPLLTATITPNPSPVCVNGTLNLSVPNAGVGATYTWSGNGVVNANSNTTTAVPNATGSQAYAVTVTAPGSCSATGTVNVTVNPRPSATITPSPNPVCQNSTLNLSVPSAGGGASYNWSGSGIVNTNANTTTAVPSASGSQPYAVTVTDGNGCSATSSTNVTVNAQPSATITPNPSPVCQNSTLNLSVPNAGGGASYNWSGNGVVNANSNATTAVPTTTGSQAYAVTVTNANTCSNTGSVNVTVNPQPSAIITATQSSVCGPALVNLSVPSAGGGASYNWSGNGVVNANSNTTTASPNSGGNQTYQVTVTNAQGCSQTGSTTILINICIAGRIIWKTDNTSGVKDVTVTLSGDQNATVVTPLNGTYSFNFNSGSSFMITPSKNLNKLNGVNAQDVFRLQQHLSGGLLTDPYLLAAADVSANNMISALDVNIIQLSLLGNPQALAQFIYSWRFVPTTHTMTNPPWGYPEKITIANAGSGLANLDFYGIKIGDVTAIYANPANASGNPMVLRVQDQFLKAGQTVSVDFTADQLADLTAFQLALRFDPTQLRLSDIQSLTALPLSEDNFGVDQDGLIRVLWAGTDAVALRAPSPIFRLSFTALQSGGKLSDVLGLDNSVLPAHVYNSKDAESDLSLRFFEVTGTNDPTLTQDRLVLYQNQPNPFEHETLIGFYLPEAAKTAFTVYDVNGRLVYRQDINGNKGYNQLTLKDKVLPNAGLFYYRVETATASATRKMVKIE